MQYFITYVLGHYADSGKKAELGTIVHKTLEVLAALKKATQELKPRQKYLEIEDDAIGKYRIDKSLLLLDETVNDILEKSFASYTSESKHEWTNGDKKECAKLVWNTLKFNGGQFDPRNRDIIDPEPHFDIPIEEDWAKFTYEIDGKTVKTHAGRKHQQCESGNQHPTTGKLLGAGEHAASGGRGSHGWALCAPSMRALR